MVLRLQQIGRGGLVAAVIAGFAVLGAGYMLLSTHAATAVVSLEPENATLSGSVVQIADSAASSSKAVKFASTAPPPPGCTLTDKLVNPCRPLIGGWSDDYGASGLKNMITEHESRIGRQVNVAHEYYPAGKVPLSADGMYYVNRPNTILLANWKPAQRWADAGGGNATINAQIDQTAKNLKAVAPKKVILNVFHEPENDISTGMTCQSYVSKASSGSPTEYRAMWQNVRNRFDAQGVTNVVWAVNYMGAAKWNCVIKDLWPGNNLVDWVLYDPYGENTTTSWDDSVGSFYKWLNANSDATHDFKSKPYGLGEYGIWNNSSATNSYKYYDDALNSIKTNKYPNLKMLTVFDAIGISDSRISYVNGVLNPTETAHYKSFVNDPFFQ
jgi:hypothetical protein